MGAITHASWRERTIRIQTFPVLRISTRDALPDAYIATVRIERGEEVLADWHLPYFSERWLSEGEARRDALEYAVKLIDSGVLDTPQEPHVRVA